jgi:hypothetical protein
VQGSTDSVDFDVARPVVSRGGPARDPIQSAENLPRALVAGIERSLAFVVAVQVDHVTHLTNRMVAHDG